MYRILDVYYDNQFDADKEKAIGTAGVLIKLGQGGFAEYRARKCDFIDRAKRVGMPWGGFWQMDARYSPDVHKAAIRSYDDYGPLGLWLAVEKPYYPCPEWWYWRMPYAGYKMIESVWRGVGYPSFYSNIGMWNLVMGGAPWALQQEMAQRSPRMWVAQYGVMQPTLYGAWQRYAMWQYQEGPDYSVVSAEDLAAILGQTAPAPTPVPAPVPEPVPQPVPVPDSEILFDGSARLWHPMYAGAQCHVIELDLAKFSIEFDDGYSPSSTTHYQQKTGVQIAINGLDGFSGGKLAGGFVVNKGVQFGRSNNQEETLWISAAKVFSLKRPSIVSAACCFPNRLVVDGKIPKINKDPNDIRARTAFGVNKDQTKGYLFVCDGADYYSKVGLSFQNVAAFMVQYCDLAVMGDGGGSTTMVIEGVGGYARIIGKPCGENTPEPGQLYPQRSVAVHTGLRRI
jgi:hypothetical protein